jgi:hypothetical protein
LRKWSLNVEIAREAGHFLDVLDAWRCQVALQTLPEEEVFGGRNTLPYWQHS